MEMKLSLLLVQQNNFKESHSETQRFFACLIDMECNLQFMLVTFFRFFVYNFNNTLQCLSGVAAWFEHSELYSGGS